MDDVKATAETVVDAVRDAAASVAAKAGLEPPAPLPETRAELLALHADYRHRRDAAPHDSHERAHAMAEIGRIEVEIARLERAMDPPRV